VLLLVELFAAGLLASIIGSMVGLGGGFLAVPLLRLVFGFAPAEAAGTSLALVVANSASATFAYALQKRVHYGVGLWLAAGGLPGSIAGALLVKHLSTLTFDWLFAALITAIAADILINRSRRAAERGEVTAKPGVGMSPLVAVVCGLFMGLVSSLFGIGAGAVLVPTMLYFSQLPAHVISATSQFGILLTAPVGLTAHIMEGDVRLAPAIPLVLGGLAGGPIGARLSRYVSPRVLLIIVAAAMLLAAGSLALLHLI
jgi:uncharacterized protein